MGTRLPENWRPSEDDLEYGLNLGLNGRQIYDMAEDMRLWAGANANRAIARKANWSMTFKGWMRREAKKDVQQNGKSEFKNALRQLGRFAEVAPNGEFGQPSLFRLCPPGSE